MDTPSPTLGTTALTKRSADTLLMPPPPLPKRQKRPPKVLDEDVYSDALSHIIFRGKPKRLYMRTYPFGVVATMQDSLSDIDVTSSPAGNCVLQSVLDVHVS
ncbi:hypothetical protein B0A55_05790 [Friedmanniomyces simplex]|uniref:Uncharacterized protein n=1 Tax=Friedmanniomyces simplex TaxID=329884 RepID=A0A4U0XJ43_9PEZI|nr:hypothetical protein B0A55_05790 [Friedmanniomyces simplex]